MKARRKVERIENRLFRAAKRRAMSKDLDFTISKDDIIVPTLCPLTEIPLRSHDGVDDGEGPRFDSPTLDRVYPHLGYIPGNVRVISLTANAMMGGSIDPELLQRSALIFSQRIQQYLNNEALYDDINSRHRNGCPVVRHDDGTLHLVDEPRDRGSSQLSFPFG